jgi:hypothetical protein
MSTMKALQITPKMERQSFLENRMTRKMNVWSGICAHCGKTINHMAVAFVDDELNFTADRTAKQVRVGVTCKTRIEEALGTTIERPVEYDVRPTQNWLNKY